MHVDADAEQELFRSRGMATLSTTDGIDSFERMLNAGSTQLGVCSGAGDRLRRLLGLVAEDQAPEPVDSEAAEPVGGEQLSGLVRQELTRIAAEVLKMRQGELRADANLSQYGFESITIAQFTRRVGEHFGVALTPAVFFEHNSIASFANFLLACQGEERCRSSFAVAGPLCQVMALGVIAQRLNTTLTFDPVARKITNNKAANELLADVPPRKGWAQYYKL